jgi:hypothetical protein
VGGEVFSFYHGRVKNTHPCEGVRVRRGRGGERGGSRSRNQRLISYPGI